MFGPARSSRIDARAGIHRGNFRGVWFFSVRGEDVERAVHPGAAAATMRAFCGDRGEILLRGEFVAKSRHVRRDAGFGAMRAGGVWRTLTVLVVWACERPNLEAERSDHDSEQLFKALENARALAKADT